MMFEKNKFTKRLQFGTGVFQFLHQDQI